jgi:protoheme IX farnesyltransferase
MIDAPLGGARQRIADYFALTKPRVVAMILVTTLAGYYLGAGSALSFVVAVKLMLGTALAGGGTLELNQYVERYIDGLMERTRRRPLPMGRLQPVEALLLGSVSLAAGFFYLALAVNWMTAGVIGIIAILYLGAYTSLKRFTWVCNIIGAVPGALPPVAGWFAARRGIAAEPVILFGIMYLWQVPHTLAIARLYRHDYERAGIHIYPPDGPRANAVSMLTLGVCVMLAATSVMPTLFGFAGQIYFWVALLLGLGMLACGVELARNPEKASSARRVLMASLIYLPLVLLALVVDKI